MNFEPRDEDVDLREAVAALLDNEWSGEHVRRAERGGADARQLWSALAKLDLLGLLVREADGGAGGDLRHGCVVQLALGERLAQVPFGWSSMFGAVLTSGADASRLRTETIRGIASGQRPLTAGFSRPVGPAQVARLDVDPVRTGTFRIAWPELAAAAVLVDAAQRQGDRVTVPLMELDGADDLVVPRRSDVQSIGRVTVTPARLAALPHLVVGVDEFRRAVAVLELGLAAFAVGAQRRLRALAAGYASEREQFGRPIGAFQAVAHKCVDIAVRCELDEALLDLAVAASAEPDHATFARAASVAKARASAGFVEAAGATLQVFGGHGFSEENDVQLYYRAACGLAAAWGVPSALLATAERPPGHLPAGLGL